MIKKKLLLISLGTVLVIALSHILAIKLSWYYIFRWFDIPVHILGGFWVVITSYWIFLKYHKTEIILSSKTLLSLIFFSVLIVGVLWEIFELMSGNTSTGVVNYWQDTFTDVACGFVGGIIAGIYFSSLKYN